MQYFSSDFKLGILGGGQLGKMLLRECAKFDIYTIVLDPSKDAPCSKIASEFFVGDLMDYDTVLSFGEKADIITISPSLFIKSNKFGYSPLKYSKDTVKGVLIDAKKSKFKI